MKIKIAIGFLLIILNIGFLKNDCYGQDKIILKSVEEQNFSFDKLGDSIVLGKRIFWGNMKTNYTQNGLIQSNEFFNNKGLLTSRSVYFYDSKEIKSHMITYNSFGVQIDSIKINFDVDGCEINNLCFNRQGDLYKKFEFICNADNKKTKEDWFNSSGEKEMTMKYTYDSHGFVQGVISVDHFNHRYDSIIYIKDKYGNILESKNFKMNGKLDNTSTYEYKFDKFGNWIEMIRYFNDSPSNIVRRRIEYYE